MCNYCQEYCKSKINLYNFSIMWQGTKAFWTNNRLWALKLVNLGDISIAQSVHTAHQCISLCLSDHSGRKFLFKKLDHSYSDILLSQKCSKPWCNNAEAKFIEKFDYEQVGAVGVQFSAESAMRTSKNEGQRPLNLEKDSSPSTFFIVKASKKF